MTTDTLPTMPDSLERCPAAISTAKKLIHRIQADDDYSTDALSWDKARVRSLERYELTFTDEEAHYFNQLLDLLTNKLET